MSSAISAISAPANTSATSGTSSTAHVQHKHGAHSLQGTFSVAAHHALKAVGAATVGVSHHVAAALNNLKAG